MGSYLDREVKGIIVHPGPKPELEEAEGSLRELFKKAGFDFFEIVQTPYGRDNDFVMLVDNDGLQFKKSYNSAAQYLSGYPMEHPIVGSALFLSIAWVDDGEDCVNLSDAGASYIMDPAKWADTAEGSNAPDPGGYIQWRFAMMEHINYYERRFPLLTKS